MIIRALVFWITVCLVSFLIPLAHAKSKWLKANIEGMRVYSESNEGKTRKLLAELSDARGTLNLLFPDLVQKSRTPLNVYIFKSRKSFSKVAPLYNGKTSRHTVGLYLENNYEGPCLIIVAEGEHEQIRATAFHEYVHYLLHQPGFRLPPWLDEGFAELFSTIERKKDDQVIVGTTIPSSVFMLQEYELIPFESFFRINHQSHEYRSGSAQTGVFYAQAWAFTHFLMYGEHNLPQNAFHKLFNRAKNGKPIYEADIIELLGVNYEELEKLLTNYFKKGKFTQLVYGLPASESVKGAALTPISEGEVQLIHGSILLATRGAQEAYPFLARAEHSLKVDPMAASFLGYHAMAQERWDNAVDDLEKAIELGGDSPYLYLHYATALLREEIPNHAFYSEALDEKTTKKLLAALHHSKKRAGGFSEELYKRFGEVFLSSMVRPNDQEIGIVVEGHHLYPHDEWIALYIAQYLVSNQRRNEATEFLNFLSQRQLEPIARGLYKTLSQRMENAVNN